jgi:hypothetical protein
MNDDERKALHERLDQIATQPCIIRKYSPEQSEECPIYNPYDDLWEESDAQLRERRIASIKASYLGRQND